MEEGRKRFILCSTGSLFSSSVLLFLLYVVHTITNPICCIFLLISLITMLCAIMNAVFPIQEPTSKPGPLTHCQLNVVLKEPHECCICLGVIVDEHNCRLPCTHVYHIPCIKKWFDQKMACPICLRPPNPSPSLSQP